MNHQYLRVSPYNDASLYLKKHVLYFNSYVLPFMRNFGMDDKATIEKYAAAPDFFEMREFLISREVEDKNVSRDYATMLFDTLIQKYFKKAVFPNGTYCREDKELDLKLPTPHQITQYLDLLCVEQDENGKNVLSVNEEALKKTFTRTLNDPEQKLWEAAQNFVKTINELGYGRMWMGDIFSCGENNKWSVSLFTC